MDVEGWVECSLLLIDCELCNVVIVVENMFLLDVV